MELKKLSLLSKHCPKCGLDLPLSAFSFYKKQLKSGEVIKKPYSYCKKCRVIVNTISMKRHGHKLKEIHKHYKLLSKYGITLEEYTKIKDAQNSSCAICENPLEIDRDIHLDHCHSTGKVRGILCRPCNHGLGMFRDNIVNLKKAIKYLEKER